MAYQRRLGDGIRSVSFIVSWADNLLSFQNSLPEKFCSKKWFFKKMVSRCPKWISFGLSQSVAYHLKWGKLWTMRTAVSFAAFFDREWIFLIEFLSKKGFLTLVDSSSNFSSGCKKVIRGCDARWIAWRSSWEHFKLRSVVDSWSDQGTLWI